MISRKSCIIAMVLVIAAGSTIYGISELAPPAITVVGGSAQYIDHTFEEKVEKAGIVVEGKIEDVQIKAFPEEIFLEQEDGTEVLYDSRMVPYSQVTIKIQEVFKDNYGLDSDTLIAYDRNVKSGIGKVEGVKAHYVSQDAIDYHVGDRGIFLVENDRGLWVDGFANFYKLEDGKDVIDTEFDKKYGKKSIELEKAKATAKTIGKK